MDIEKLKNELVRDEGLKLKPYKCTAGKLTIGVGRNLDDIGISREEAMVMLDNDIYWSTQSAKEIFPNFDKLSDGRKRAMVNMMFNLGLSRFRGFKNMITAMNAGMFEKASREALNSKWAAQVGDRASRIANLIKNG